MTGAPVPMFAFPPDEDRVEDIFARLSRVMPEPKTELNFSDPFTLVVAVALSAQATDVGVNKATEKVGLAAKYNRVADKAQGLGLVKKMVRPSAGWLLVYSRPIRLPAPGRFSTTTDSPRVELNCSPMPRASASPTPPAAKGTMSLMG